MSEEDYKINNEKKDPDAVSDPFLSLSSVDCGSQRGRGDGKDAAWGMRRLSLNNGEFLGVLSKLEKVGLGKVL